MSIKIVKKEKLTWVNIDQVNPEAITYLKNEYNFHHLDLEDIQSESQIPKIDTYKNYLFIILQIPHWNPETKTVVSDELDLFVGEGYVITIQHSKSTDMQKFFYRSMKKKGIKREWMGQTPGFLVYHIIQSLFQESRHILNGIGKQITDLEQMIFEDKEYRSVVRDLALHRRNILHFRRIIDPQRYLMANLSNIRKPFLHEETSLYFDDVNDYLNKLWSIVERYQDSIVGFHATVESLLTQKTNKVISALTIISVALLPLTLLTGIYGMNINNLPLAHTQKGVWTIFGALATIIILFILLMKKKRWF